MVADVSDTESNEQVILMDANALNEEDRKVSIFCMHFVGYNRI